MLQIIFTSRDRQTCNHYGRVVIFYDFGIYFVTRAAILIQDSCSNLAYALGLTRKKMHLHFFFMRYSSYI